MFFNWEIDKMSGIIFVSGIHGVGKTVFCRELSSEFHFQHYTSSDLINKFSRKNLGRNKAVHDVESNQQMLAQSIDQFINPTEWVLLDGHFTLFDKDYHVIPIAMNLFRQLNLRSIISMFCDTEIIYERLNDRDGKKYPITLLEHHQQLEMQRANTIAEYLHISIIQYESTKDGTQVKHLIKKLLLE